LYILPPWLRIPVDAALKTKGIFKLTRYPEKFSAISFKNVPGAAGHSL
jgi:hypothetical protein